MVHLTKSMIRRVNFYCSLNENLSLNSILEKTLTCSFDPPKCTFVQFGLKVVFAVVIKESYR